MLRIRILVLLLLAFGLTSVSMVRAQSTESTAYVTLLHRNAEFLPAAPSGGAHGPGTSGVQVQNLDATASATLVMDWWPQSGGRPIPIVLPPLLPLSSGNAYLPTEGRIGNGLYALIAHADRRIAAVARTEWPTTGGAVLFSNSRPAKRLIVPLIACRFAGQTAYISIQNTNQSDPTTVVTKFFVSGSTTPVESHQRRITEGTSITFSACDLDTPNLSYVGYLTAEAEVPITAQAYVNIETAEKPVYAFEGLPDDAAAERLHVPLFRNNYYGTTGISVVNPGPAATRVSVHFVGALGQCVGQRYSQGPVEIAPGSSALFYQANVPVSGTGVSPLPHSCAGSATIDAEGGKVLAVVNDATGNPGAPAASAAYVAMSAAQAARRVALPLFRNRHTRFQLTTGIQAVNVGDTMARAQIRFVLSDGTQISALACGPACNVTIAPGAAKNWYPPAIAALPSGKYGSAFIDSDQPLAVIVNDVSLTGALDAAIYNGLNADEPAP